MSKAKKAISLLLVLTILLMASPISLITQTSASLLDRIELGEVLFTDGDTSFTLSYSATSGNATIVSCNGSVRGAVTIPTTIGNYTVTAIGAAAFKDQLGLTEMTLPRCVVSVGAGAFEGCFTLATVHYDGTRADRKVIVIGDNNEELTTAVWHCTDDCAEHAYDNGCDADCNVCGDVREVPGHVYDNDCDTTCNVCGETRDVEHIYKWIVDTQPDCGNDGTKHEECVICGDKKNENTVMSATGNHTYDNDCDATCNVCGGTHDVEHIYEWVVDDQADCGNDGKKHEECTKCGDVRNANTVIPATGKHTYDDGCDADCNICGYIRDAGHIFEWVIDAEATCGADGKKHEECTKCGDIRNANTVIPSTGKHGYDDEYDMDCNGCGTSRANGSCGKNAYWRLENGTLIIGGSGAMSSYTSYTKTPWKEHKNNIVSLKIDKDITEIGKYAFASFLGLKEVEFESGSVLHTIHDNAFHYCHLLKTVDIPDTVVFIGFSAFGYCAGLTDVYMPECAATLYKDIFVSRSSKLMLNVVEGYKAHVYAEKYDLPFVTRKASVPEGDALPGETVVASGTCGENATWTVYKSGKMIIGGSGAIDKYKYPDKTPWASVKADVLSIKIGKDITEIGNYAFAAFFACEKVLFEENSVLHTLNDHSFHLSSKLKTVVLPDTVTFMGFAVFGYCEKLETVYMPECAKSIYTGAFINCNPDVVLNVVDGFVAHNYAIRNNLKYVTRPALAPNMEALPGETIIGSGKCGENATWTLYMSGKFIIEGTGALYDYSSHKTTPWFDIKGEARYIRIGNGITEIGTYALAAFYDVKRVVFEEGSQLRVLKNNAFHYCSAMKELVLPESVVEIQFSALGYCLKMETIYIPESTVSIYVKAFNGSNLDNLVLQVADGSYAYRYANRNNIKVEVR